MKQVRAFLGDLVFLSRPYFMSEERWSAFGLLAVTIGFTLGLVYLNVLFNSWYGRFYDALGKKDEAAFFIELTVYAVLSFIYIAVAVIEQLGQLSLQLRWRRWMTRHYLSRWFTHRAYYRVELLGSADNPDQRIAEDVRTFIDSTVERSLGLLSAIVTFVSFVAILWSLSGPLSFVLVGSEVTIAGYMVWVAVLYAIIGTLLAHLIGRRLIPLNFRKEVVEADFRFGLVRTRENAEAIALYRGERHEEPALRASFQQVLDVWWATIKVRLSLYAYSVSYSQIATIFPFVVASPRFFAGAITLGALIQISTAFTKVQEALSYFVKAYQELAAWRAQMQRLQGFDRAVTAAATLADGPEVSRDASAAVSAEGLTLSLPDGRTLLDDATLSFAPGTRSLVMGASGSGKSTLFRALAGIWPFGSGRVQVPSTGRALFLPQKTYLPIASLRDVVRYPDPATEADDEAIREALRAVRLEHLAGRLEEVAHWAQRLSPGEQQRLAIARALLYKPDWLYLDEATASVDEDVERLLYELLRQRLPHTTIVSIGHRSSLKQWHDRFVTLGRDANGKGRLMPA
jgi:putative ATP-binding cassette transporter